MVPAGVHLTFTPVHDEHGRGRGRARYRSGACLGSLEGRQAPLAFNPTFCSVAICTEEADPTQMAPGDTNVGSSLYEASRVKRCFAEICNIL
jgi:hypothetical protein